MTVRLTFGQVRRAEGQQLSILRELLRDVVLRLGKTHVDPVDTHARIAIERDVVRLFLRVIVRLGGNQVTMATTAIPEHYLGTETPCSVQGSIRAAVMLDLVRVVNTI